MALKATDYQHYWTEEIAPEAVMDFEQAYAAFPRSSGGRKRSLVLSNPAMAELLYGAGTDKQTIDLRLRRFRAAIRDIADSFAKFYYGVKADELSRNDLSKMTFVNITQPEIALRVSNAIYDIPEYKDYFHNDKLHPKYLTGWLWESRISTLKGNTSSDSAPVLPPIRDILTHR
ncbi:hypothetical protein TWF970_010781 [Orbilia oligospora]|uniref:Uncharacterized protein n=1 Tax=Orbilia oligospora TaxID=2813651 RepID=A0A7C8R223_ORBOL|nr:hypothetical protein TWF970_010781 [Orbilia oligospora]